MDFPTIGELPFSVWLEDNGYTDQDFPYGKHDSLYESCYINYKEEQEYEQQIEQ